jgi:REP element-mobilizing transposase RayT
MFLDALGEVSKRYSLEVHAFALMPNHFHLLVRSVRGNLSLCMQKLLGPYTQTLNAKHDWDGPVFRGRFKNQLVSESEHLQVVVPYIHLNPVKANLVTNPESATWTSYAAYTGEGVCPDWLTRDVVMEMYGTRERLVEETWAYHRGEIPWPMDFDLQRGIFTSWSPEVPRMSAQREAWQAHQISVVKQVYGLVTEADWTETQTSSRGRKGNPFRRLAVWLFMHATDLPHSVVCEELGTTLNQLSMMLHRLKKERLEEPLAGWVQKASFWLAENIEG